MKRAFLRSPTPSRRRRLARISARLSRYRQRELRGDAVAGLTVAVMGVPQAMAYAMIVDLPPAYGLYTAIATCTVAALLGSSSHVVTGPTNATCMVLLSLVGPLVATRGASPVELVLMLTLLAGLIQLGFGLLRLGNLVRYVSNSVVVGFTAGAGILIAANQLRNILGVDIDPGRVGRFHEVIVATVRMVPHANPYAIGVAVVTAVVAIFAPRWIPKVPGSLVGFVVGGALVAAFGWHRAGMGAWRVDIVRDIEPIHANLLAMFRIPEVFRPFDFRLAHDLGTGALALAILGLIETTSIARTIASSSGQRLDFSRQFIGQGAGNVVGCFFSCFAGSGSLARSAVCYQSGGRTRMAPVFSAVWTAIIVVLFAPLANYVPKPAVAGVLVVIAYSMIDKRRLRLTLRSSAASRLVVFGTLASTLVFPLQYAIFIGVSLSILILLQVTGKVDLTQLVPRQGRGFEEVPFNRAPPSPVVTINMEGDLYFAAVEDLDYELLRCLTLETRVVVLRMKRLRAVGSTAMNILEHFWDLLRKRGIRLIVCGIEDDLAKVMTGSGLRAEIGESNIFYADNRLFQSTELAHARAWSIVEAERRRAAAKKETDAGEVRVTAGDLMTPGCIRFGNRHQLREAVLLMSELKKRMGPQAPSSLFLQDREGRLYGELSTERMLRELRRGLGDDAGQGLGEGELGRRLRRHFTDNIGDMVLRDLPRLKPDTSLEALLSAYVQLPSRILPICNVEGAAVGLVAAEDLLAELGRRFEVGGGGEGAGAGAG